MNAKAFGFAAAETSASPLGAAMPCNIDAEQALLGILLYDSSAFQRIIGLEARYFCEPFHQRAFAELFELFEQNKPADHIVLTERLKNDPAFDGLGGRQYLVDLIDKAPPPIYAGSYAEAIIDGWTRRAAVALCREAEPALAVSPDPAFALIKALRAGLEEIERGACSGDDGLVTAVDAGADLIAALEAEAVNGRDRGLMCGLRCIDRRLRGLRPGWLVVIGGRPSMWKTGLARGILYGAAGRNPQSLFLLFALEMDRREITERALSARDEIPYVDLGGTSLTPEDRERLKILAQCLPTNVLIDDRSTVTVDEIRRKIWALKRRGPVGAVVIDYLQLLVRPQAQGRNDAAVIAEMTSTLKRIAKETGTCILLLSQLSRAVESRDDKRPQLADLRESGSIEQDANAVLFPFRQSYYTERAEPDAGTPEHAAWRQKLELERRRLDVIAAKVRGGAIGTDRQEVYIEFDHVADLIGDA
jgi:replicative DNA helicase